MFATNMKTKKQSQENKKTQKTCFNLTWNSKTKDKTYTMCTKATRNTKYAQNCAQTIQIQKFAPKFSIQLQAMGVKV